MTLKRGESLIRKSTNRYLTTVRIAFRAKQRRFDDFDGLLKSQLLSMFKDQLLNLAMNKISQFTSWLILLKEQRRWKLLKDLRQILLFDWR